MAQRRNDIDVVKGISMLCIVVGHLGIGSIEKFVFTFHVPIFLIISGLFFTPRDGLIKKRFTQMVKPYLSTGLIMYLIVLCKTLVKLVLHRAKFYEFTSITLNAILGMLYGSGSRHDFFNFELPVIGALWFFLSIFWATAILYYIEKWVPGKLKGIVIILLFLVSFLSAKLTWLPFSIQAGASSVFFLYVGYLAKKHQLLEKPIQPLWCVCAVLLWSVALYFSYWHGNMSIVCCAFPDPLINVGGAVAASYLIISLVRKMDEIEIISASRPYHFLCYWGRFSGTVLCCHVIEYRMVNWNLFSNLGKSFLIVVFILKLILITGGTWFIQKHKKIRKLF